MTKQLIALVSTEGKTAQEISAEIKAAIIKDESLRGKLHPDWEHVRTAISSATSRELTDNDEEE